MALKTTLLLHASQTAGGLLHAAANLEDLTRRLAGPANLRGVPMAVRVLPLPKSPRRGPKQPSAPPPMHLAPRRGPKQPSAPPPVHLSPRRGPTQPSAPHAMALHLPPRPRSPVLAPRPKWQPAMRPCRPGPYDSDPTWQPSDASA